MGEFKIEHNVALPKSGSRPGTLLAAMRELSRAPIGASIYFKEQTRDCIAASARNAAGPGWYTLRKQPDGGVRIWKLAEPKTAKVRK